MFRLNSIYFTATNKIGRMASKATVLLSIPIHSYIPPSTQDDSNIRL